MKILIIEDDENLLDSLVDLFTKNNFKVESFTNLDEIDDYAVLNKFDLIILDLMLGDYNGFEFLRCIRKDILAPIIILTAKDSKSDILTGFKLGADDYITKPFDNDILIARIKCHLKIGDDDIVYYKDTKFNMNTGVISFKNTKIHLTYSELEILRFMLNKKGSFISKSQFMDSSYLINENSSERTVISHIYNIRKKIQDIKGDDPIENKWGVGYRWKEQ
ncbi:MAG: response regulator transcription factor [Peptoniphilaceae bacterium]|uniref:response regulator transcription factor n=1 Tax=Parvimonas sp. TaxID=1944660 RepID=UPI0025FA9807|nr:response regulator transcription factor [Parvimonas sp.]MCI5997344.1 response regulator transcription factor [Parvimonas sp.]MDD7765399.1 response regulator transcription factor [Peptoniphilaceae bacterium]MDY3050665.1 response regulator transcription factor [Parvimonas sp.]